MHLRGCSLATGLIFVTVTGAVGIIHAAPAPQAQMQPRDLRAGEPRPASARELQLRTLTSSDPTNVSNWLELARLQEERGATQDAERTFTAALAATGNDRLVLTSTSTFFVRLGEFGRAMEALEKVAAINPGDAQAHQLVAVYYYDKASKDQRLAPGDRARYVEAGLAATDRAIALNADYFEALVYKNLLLRLKASAEEEPRRSGLIAEADALRERALALQKGKAGAPLPPGVPPPPPPPAPPAAGDLLVDGMSPMRVGGNIKAPAKLHDVRPEYPQEALNAGVSGMVIIEAVIDTQGSVHSAKVLRSIPLLDSAAVDAVKGWRFAPTLFNGAPVPIIMTVTVNFTRQ